MGAEGLQTPAKRVETSPTLSEAQAEKVPAARGQGDVTTLPDNVPLLIVANEFFDALPIHQLVATKTGWRERLVTVEEDRFVPAAGSQIGRASCREGVCQYV